VDKHDCLVADGEDLIPFPAPQAQIRLAREEVTEIGVKKLLELVEVAASSVDTILQNAARETITGHQYSNVEFRGQGRAGDAYSSNWTGTAPGASHRYDGVVVEKGGKGLLGNKFGGKNFWDD
jgi:hypothetical protein